MATTQHLLLSPAELAYLHSTLSLTPPIRHDGRTATQFRPLSAETGVLPGTNGSARICFADGTEAIVGVKAEVEKTKISPYEDANGRKRVGKGSKLRKGKDTTEESEGSEEEDEDLLENVEAKGSNSWVDISVEVPGYRDDDSATVFLGTMLGEALLADGDFTRRLWINRRFHWKIYLDVGFYCTCRYMLLETNCGIDRSHISPLILSPAITKSHNTPCTLVDTASSSQVGSRRRPHV